MQLNTSNLKVLPVDGSELTYLAKGEGPPVLLIHGAGGLIEIWNEVQGALATTHKVVAYDRRGLGRSPNPTPDVRVHARDAAAMIEQVAGEPSIVVGWSWGASVAMELIRSHPKLVKAAVLIEPTFHFRPSVGTLLQFIKAQFMSSLGRKRAGVGVIFRTLFGRRSGGSGWDELDTDQRELFFFNMEGPPAEAKPHEFWFDLKYISVSSVASWTVPVKYLIGDDTLREFEKCLEVLTSEASQIKTVRIPGACHLIPLQEPDAVVEAVRG